MDEELQENKQSGHIKGAQVNILFGNCPLKSLGNDQDLEEIFNKLLHL